MKDFEAAFKYLRRSRDQAPHKPCLLLAIFDSIEAGDIKTNEIRYAPRLLERFERYFKVARSIPKNFRPFYPFVYLDSIDFWHLHKTNGTILRLSGNERDKLAVSGVRRVFESIEYASLDKELFASLLNSATRNRYREVLISTYFPELRHDLWKAVEDSRQQTKFENQYDARFVDTAPQHLERRTRNYLPRDSKFRDAVLSAYNHKCAATGWTLRTRNGGSLLEAAHIMPLSTCPDNRPQNGIALVPTVHKAMDEFLIVPGPDFRWHASRFLQEHSKSDAGANWLWNLNGATVKLPEDERFHPAVSALEWRKEYLS